MAWQEVNRCDHGLIFRIAALQGRELGDGVVGRVCREVQVRYWKPPDLSRGTGTSRRR